MASDSPASVRSERVVETMLEVYPTLWHSGALSRIIRFFQDPDARHPPAATDAAHPAAVSLSPRRICPRDRWRGAYFETLDGLSTRLAPQARAEERPYRRSAVGTSRYGRSSARACGASRVESPSSVSK